MSTKFFNAIFFQHFSVSLSVMLGIIYSIEKNPLYIINRYHDKEGGVKNMKQQVENVQAS